MATFPSIRIEGGLLGPDVLDQLFAAQLPGQRPADFGLNGKRNLTDEIASIFADTRALWEIFQHRLERLPESDIATTVTRDAWIIPFLGLLGYEPRYNQRAYSVDGLSFPVSHRASEAEDSPPIHIVGARQDLGRVPSSGRPRLAPHSLMQQYLNSTEVLWGLVTNGKTLRLLRDSTFVRRQAYVEFDLQAIIEEKRFEDFAALYRLLHRTRLPLGVSDASDCLLEQYYSQSEEQGGRVRDHLRDGVEECITRLANGFLSHPANDELRRRVSAASAENERITPDELYRQLLRLVYRFLFLLVSEDRGVLGAEPLYRDHYGIARLRRLLDHRAAYSGNDDIWRSLRVLWLVLSDDKHQPSLEGKPMASVLGLPVLNGDLFAPVNLDSLTLTNGDLLEAFYWLAWYKDEKTRVNRKVNYAALDVEELGSVYESLIELHPVVDRDSTGRPLFRLLFGAGRKTTGTYYTPPQLVNELVHSALEPVLRERLQTSTNDKERAILSIRVCDPACGSGHFLLAAARLLGKELARVNTDEDEPAPERIREAIRDVVSHCIYGVDKNPLAVDLCRVALWLESYTADKPLTFLDHRIRCGDSLIGVFNLQELQEGIPDKAFESLEGDDKAIARELAKRNRDERGGQFDLFSWNLQGAMSDLTVYSREVDSISNDSAEDIRRKKQAFEQSHRNPTWLREKEACDLWTAAFFQWLKPGVAAITSGAILERLAERPIDGRTIEQALSISERQRFFHWPLEFPEVFADAGFDVILSNPPWEHVELKEQEFFAARDARVATAPTKAERTRLIRKLKETNPSLYDEFVETLRGFDAARLFLGNSGRYRLTGRGRINTYAVFAELSRSLIGPPGRSGIIVQSDIATSDTCKFFFQDLIGRRRLISFHDFVNTEGIFPAVHRTHPHFCLLTMSGKPSDSAPLFSFWNTNTSHLREPDRLFTLTAEEIWLLNPNTGNCPIFRTQADAELTKAIYRRIPVLWREQTQANSNPWKIKFSQGLFNLSSDSHHFRTAAELEADGYRREGNTFASPYDRYLPLYEGKMLYHFDHRWTTYEENSNGVGSGFQIESRDVGPLEKRDPYFIIQPRFWVREEVVESVIPKYPEPLAVALQSEDGPSLKHILCLWIAGYYMQHGDRASAEKFVYDASRYKLDRVVARTIQSESIDDFALDLATDFPLTQSEVGSITEQLERPETIAKNLVERFSPKWFLGWRDITNSTNERTLIANVLPKVAVGNSCPLIFMGGITPTERLSFQGIADSFVLDYVARQKVGGTHINYFYLKQFPFLPPTLFCQLREGSKGLDLTKVFSYVLELVYTAYDLQLLAQDCGFEGPPFQWDEKRRFEIRCELDALFFQTYLACDMNGDWQLAEGETTEQLSILKEHFITPRAAVAYIMDQFNLVRDRDTEIYGRYRTKERILEIYDAMLVAHRDGRAYETTLNPPPGVV